MWWKGMLLGTALILSTGRARAQSPAPTPPASAPPVRNDWVLGIDASVGPVPELNQDLVLAALDARFGYRLHSGRVFLTPEAVLRFVELAANVEVEGTSERRSFHSEMAWVGAGVRAGARFWRFEPALYSHGYIWYLGGYGAAPPYVTGGGTVALETGGALDIRLSRSVAVGAHAAYTIAYGKPQTDFGTLGLHVDFTR